MQDRALLARAVGWAAANWLLDAASLWVFVAAFGHVISPIDLLTAYGLANILAAVPITPGGLGVVEFVLVTMLAGFGLTDGQALSAVLAYRAVNFWLPIPFGGLAYASLELEHRSVRQRVWKQVLNAQVRTGQVLAKAFDRNARAGAATTVGAPEDPTTPAAASAPAGPPPSTPPSTAPSIQRPPTPAPTGPNPVSPYRPPPAASVATVGPGPHRGDAVGRRAP